MHEKGPIIHGDVKGVGVLVFNQTFDSTNPHNSATFWSLMKDMRFLATLVLPISLQRHLI